MFEIHCVREKHLMDGNPEMDPLAETFNIEQDQFLAFSQKNMGVSTNRPEISFLLLPVHQSNSPA